MISFVYFDVGGVVVNDFSGNDKWAKMKRDLGIKIENDKEFSDFFDKYEKEIHIGREVDTLIPLMEERFHINFPPGYSLNVDFVNRFEKNEAILPVIEKIKKDCRIGLLTNMYPKTIAMMAKKGIMPEIVWDVIVDSSIEGCQKPELKIFELAQEKANTKKENILFVDNKIENINAAKKFGWQAFLYNSVDHKKSCSDLLAYYNQIK